MASRYISRPAVSEKRLSFTPSGNARYQPATPYRDGTTRVILEPLDAPLSTEPFFPNSLIRIPLRTDGAYSY